MLNKQQEDNKSIRKIIDFYETEVASLACQVKLGDLRITEDGTLEVCNKIFGGEHFWSRVNTDGTISNQPRDLKDPQ